MLRYVRDNNNSHQNNQNNQLNKINDNFNKLINNLLWV